MKNSIKFDKNSITLEEVSNFISEYYSNEEFMRVGKAYLR